MPIAATLFLQKPGEQLAPGNTGLTNSVDQSLDVAGKIARHSLALLCNGYQALAPGFLFRFYFSRASRLVWGEVGIQDLIALLSVHGRDQIVFVEHALATPRFLLMPSQLLVDFLGREALKPLILQCIPGAVAQLRAQQVVYLVVTRPVPKFMIPP